MRLASIVYVLILSALPGPLQAALAQMPQPAFEVASVKPAPPQADPDSGSWSFPGRGRFIATNVSLTRLIQLAYGIDDSQIANKPAWLETNLYDVNAEPENGVKLSREELKPRLQNLLQERFHLIAHMETRQVRGYALVIAKGGPHLIPTRGDHLPDFPLNIGAGQMRGANWTMAQLAKYLTPAAGFPVVDATNIPGSFDISFSYNPKPELDTDSTLPPLNEGLRQATGLLLKQQNVSVETLIIDSVSKVPTSN